MAKAKSRPPTPPLCPTLASQQSSSRPLACSQTRPDSPAPSRPTTRSRSSKPQLNSYQIKGSDEVINCGDCVLMKPADPTMPPYAARVKKIEASGSHANEVNVEVCWFYRPEDCTHGRQNYHGSKEVFSSKHEGIESANAIEAKCNVHDIKSYIELDTINAEDFFCRFEYKPATGTFVPASIEKFCTCLMPYNPDEVMIQCEQCSNWFHPACIGLSVEDAKKVEHFFCDSCTATSVKISEKYQKNPKHGVLLNEKKCLNLSSTKSTEVKEDGILLTVENIFAKYNEVWSEKLETAKENLLYDIKVLLDEHSTNLASSYKEHSRALIAEVSAAISGITQGEAAISAPRAEGEDAGITQGEAAISAPRAEGEDATQRQVLEMTKKDTAQNRITDKEKTAKVSSSYHVALIYDERMLEHAPPDGAEVDELPERLSSIMQKLNNEGLANRCKLFKADVAKTESLTAVHSPDHVKQVEAISSEIEIAEVCGDMFYNKASSIAALLAVGGVIQACDMVASKAFKSCFALVRPPGHHVGKEGPAEGFCMLNNISVGATHLLRNYHMKKIVILDFDIHHGNGTRKIFYKDNRVLFISIHRHQKGFYPYPSGALDFVGEYPAEGYNINIGWKHEGINDADYLTVWRYLLLPVIQEFGPEIILISAGFDAAAKDPLGKCNVTPECYGALLAKLRSYPIVMVIEGGYEMDALSESVAACVRVFLGEETGYVEEGMPYNTTWKLVKDTLKKHKPFWRAYRTEIPKEELSKRVFYK